MTILDFLDPIANKNISYSISTKNAEKWKGLKEDVIKHNSDRVYCVVGRERSGKTFWTCQQAKFIDPTFNIERICFTPEQFLEQIRNAPKGGVVLFDEAFRGFSTRASLSKINRLLVQSMMEVGRRNLIIFIVLPVFSLLEYYIAITRSYALFVISDNKKKKYRTWRAYSEKKKAELYYKSKKNYGMIPYVQTNRKGKFFVKTITLNKKEIKVPYETFQIEEYENKKDDAFRGKKGDFGAEEESKMTRERRILLVNLFLETKKKEDISQIAFLRRLTEIGIEMTSQNFSQLMDKARKDGQILK